MRSLYAWPRVAGSVTLEMCSSVASADYWAIIAYFTLVAIGIVFSISQRERPRMAERNPRARPIIDWLRHHPSQQSRESHYQVALGLIAGIVLAFVPWGFGVMDSRPCLAWCFYALALLCGAISFWQITPFSRWIRMMILLFASGVFLYLARASLYSHTELDYFFVDPGAFSPAVGPGGAPGWIMLVNGQNTHKPIFNADMMMQDLEMTSVAKIESSTNPADASGLIKKSWYHKIYPEIDSTSLADEIIWIPFDVNAQEYMFTSTYRIGDQSFQSMEDIRIVNVGERITFANRMTARAVWQESVTVTNQIGTVLMHCIDSGFPRDEHWVDGQPCFPGPNFKPLPRSLCARCFARGFEWYRNVDKTSGLQPPVPFPDATGEQPKGATVPQRPSAAHVDTQPAKHGQSGQTSGLKLKVSIVQPTEPAIVVDNQTDVVVEGITWELVLFRVTDQAVFSYTTRNIGYIKAHSQSAKYVMEVNTLPQAPGGGGRIGTGESFIGTLAVDCPTCEGTTLIVGFVWGESGWFYEDRAGGGRLFTPRAPWTKDSISQYLKGVSVTVRPDDKIPIL